MKEIKIGNKVVGYKQPVYFIADIAANHDGDINRAKKLINLAKEAGADAVKFQHHDVSKYVSDFGFKNLDGKFSHQSKWDKSIFEVYKDAEVPLNWTEELMDECNRINIDFFTTPYDLDMVDYFKDKVPAFKIGSGDLAWHSMLKKIAETGKPVLFATGAGTMQEVQTAMEIISSINKNIVLMQCNTNYTADNSNYKYIQLNVLQTYKTMYPETTLGLSDHTKGHVTVLGAVALGAKVIEKHFTDDTNRPGPDHPFSMDPTTWANMVNDTRLLESSLGHFTKEVQQNEKETVILQRRAIRVIKDVKEGDVLKVKDIQFQRPCPGDALSVNEIDKLLNKTIAKTINAGDYLRLEHIKW
jgi:sialic acid synthase SpsE